VVGPQRARPNGGGPGLRRGRRDAAFLGVGDPVDFWQVEDVSPAPRLRLHAELRLPGDAWLTWDSLPTALAHGSSRPRSPGPGPILGRPYWLSAAPFHRFALPGLLAGTVSNSESGGQA
jgi:hypothetical protein